MKSGRRDWRSILELVLILAGIGIASYLTYVKLFGLKPYCAGVGDCEAVQTSAYSELFGIPVSILGLGSYLALLALWWVKGSNWRGFGQLGSTLFFFVSLVGVLFSAYLTYLELFVIKAICPWCVASAVVLVGIFVLSLVDVIEGPADSEEMVTQRARSRRRR